MPITVIENWKDLEPEVLKHIKQTDVVVDIGCGIKPQNLFTPKVHIGIEPYSEYIEHLEKNLANRDRTFIFINSTWDILRKFPSNSVDTIIFTDVIEHLSKMQGKKLLKEAERVAKVQVILFTSLGFLPQCHPDGKDAWGLDGGKWQDHKSGWEPKDFHDKWNIYLCEKFHYGKDEDNLFEEPYGAFWGILNIEPGEEQNQAFTVLLPGQ
ncbi:class I SAM-dependent methyltransferase [Bacillus salacetis]|uniref:class I SAM-dependent methyltransferase n=1 Tax=Bacillus salacetis TaxID=2315464 RepID=UPI001444916A|nr:class I SAM-dependent methyltransferase [Bacillus salacetis]